MSAIRCSRREGRYNFANPKEVSASLAIYLPEGAPVQCVSDTVEIGSEYDIETDDPFEMADHIRNSIKRYWISTDRERTIKALDWIEANRAALEVDYYKERACMMQERAAKAHKDAALSMAAYEDALAERGEQ